MTFENIGYLLIGLSIGALPGLVRLFKARNRKRAFNVQSSDVSFIFLDAKKRNEAIDEIANRCKLARPSHFTAGH